MVRRWLDVCPRADWDRTGQPLYQWAKAPNEMRVPGFGDAFFQIIDSLSTLEAATMIGKPFSAALRSDDGDMNHPDRRMWVHTVGQSAFGET